MIHSENLVLRRNGRENGKTERKEKVKRERVDLTYHHTAREAQEQKLVWPQVIFQLNLIYKCMSKICISGL